MQESGSSNIQDSHFTCSTYQIGFELLNCSGYFSGSLLKILGFDQIIDCNFVILSPTILFQARVEKMGIIFDLFQTSQL